MIAESSVPAEKVHTVLSEHLLTDGFKLVLDTKASSGSWLVDARDGTRYLDMYTFFASAPLGCNPPGIVDDPDFMAQLGELAANKPANSDVYTTHLAEFTKTFTRVLGDAALPHLFFVEGGALAVENALKAAFDWKSRHNEAAGRDPELGGRILHLTRAFHGRSGYTMSLTNTEPGKTARFPAFDWPRIDVPAIRFPLAEHLDDVMAAEERALSQARAAFAAHPHDIAAFICEPIQGEGGDNHMRPEFLRAMQDLAHEHDALFIVDEVQTGVGLTGTPWAYQQFGLSPDIVAFAKKAQVGGIMAGGRIDEVADNVFAVSGRINSTWGGGLVDMVRSRRLLEIIERDAVIESVGPKGEYFLTALTKAASAAEPGVIGNVRGRGLMLAADLPDRATRDAVIADMRETEHLIVLPSGPHAVRFRPALSVTHDEIDHAVAAFSRAVARQTS
ncbi:L-lysine 6-transaminase [Actinobacteria bacterium YIM 96077]|uniref:L-lysine-epsilon aminotransferase n=1 Tax=Phytoactinopolyspora halophila TaxID=1981511 RepID=A0A329R0F8_9ACTN|nr:L-lysine 6-transaminase [Phytoactinopolyspora halophila]AYY13296.1 L-lysine 6-transaminase [Actinobacteria bacterium YIM 96077]RAW17469.1 L-lysine 6-transaminase [Phytoactinopolyspora halophila]